ncbi:MAG: 30S ribosomal protein S17 [Candidatus Omnitrophota bacterium]|nr:30S ribosomal protein S17 [Candidatus Omnitrophota bacterium]
MLEGTVVKDKMNKTIVVEVTRLMRHATYQKTVRRKIKYAVHDETNQAKTGNKVRIAETRPLSKTKRWRLVEVMGK